MGVLQQTDDFSGVYPASGPMTAHGQRLSFGNRIQLCFNTAFSFLSNVTVILKKVLIEGNSFVV